MRLKPEHRVAILLHEGTVGTSGKTGLSLIRYSEANIVVVIDRLCAGESFSELTRIPRQLPIVASVQDSLSYSPDVLVIGIAPSGGALPAEWLTEIKQAIMAGMSIVNGLHTHLAEDEEFRELLTENQWIWDVRREPARLAIGSAASRSLSCRRVLTVGTDMSIGKMSTSLELNRVSQQRGLKSKFLATGQAGLMIAGDGIPLDAVRVDFAAGAVEQLVMRFGNNYEILHIEGQGSLLHPGSTATLPLLRGSQPTHLILVHRAGQKDIRKHPHVLIPPLDQVVLLYEMVASAAGALNSAKVAAIALNTHHLTDDNAAQDAIAQVTAQTGLPCTDPVRFGADILLDAILAI